MTIFDKCVIITNYVYSTMSEKCKAYSFALNKEIMILDQMLEFND